VACFILDRLSGLSPGGRVSFIPGTVVIGVLAVIVAAPFAPGSAAAFALVFILVLVNAFFVNGEFAFVAVDQSHVRDLARHGNTSARGVLVGLESLSFQLSGAQLGITVTSLALGFFADEAVARFFEGPLESLPGVDDSRMLSLGVGFVAITVFQMVFGELIPKNLALARPLESALSVGNLMRRANTLMKPVIKVFNGTANWTVRRFGIEPSESLTRVRSLDEFELLFRSSAQSGALEEGEVAMLRRVIGFKGKTAQDVMVPRTALQALQVDETIEDLISLAVATGFSRFPVYNEDLDDIVGMLHVKDAYGVPFAERATRVVGEVAAPVYSVPESRRLEWLIRDLRGRGRQRGRQMAVVIDEYGGTAGIITLEDLLEEIVGSIEDEYDVSEGDTTELSPGTWLVDGGLHHDELLDQCGFHLPRGEWETLAGFLLWKLERIPRRGDQVETEGWILEVIEMDKRRVARVHVSLPPSMRSGQQDTEATGDSRTRDTKGEDKSS